MSKLEDLSLELLNDLAKECNIKFEKKYTKKEKIVLIKNAGIDQKALEKLIVK